MFWTWMFMILGYCITYTSSQAFSISRQTSGVDTFNMPAFMCSDPLVGCSSFRAAGSSCSCSCAGTHSTFTFVNNRWQCMANIGARNRFQRGCEARTQFSGENADRRIPTLVIGGRREIALHYQTFQSIVTCSLNLRSSSFVGCDGSRRLLTNQHYNAAVRMFTISKRFPSSRYILQVKAGVPNSNLLQGKVINVIMDCAARWFGTNVVSVESCLVFKLQGTQTCPVNRTTSSTSSSTYVASFTASRLQTHSRIIQSSTSVPTVLATSLTASAASHMIPNTSPTVSMWPRTSFLFTSITPLSSPTVSNITPKAVSISQTISVNSALISEFTSRLSLSSPSTASSPAPVSVLTSRVPLSTPSATVSTPTVSNFPPPIYSSSPATSYVTLQTSSIPSSFSSPTFSYSTPLSITSLTISSVSPTTAFVSSSIVSSGTPKASSSLTASSTSSSFSSPTPSYITPLSVTSMTASTVSPKTASISLSTVSIATPKASSSLTTASYIATSFSSPTLSYATPLSVTSMTASAVSPETSAISLSTVFDATPKVPSSLTVSSTSSSFSSPTLSYTTPLSVTTMTASTVSPKTASISLSTVSNASPKASSSLTTGSHIATRASDSMPSQTTPFLRSWGTLTSSTATFEATPTSSEVTPKASVSSSTVSEVIPSSSPTLIGFVSSSTVSDTAPRASVSSPTAFSRRTTAEILPAPSNVPPTVMVLPEVIEVSTTLKKALETPFVLPPTEPGVQPTSFERNIPPTIVGGRKGNVSQMYIGLIAGIVAAIVVLVIVVILLVCRRRYFRHTFRVRSASEETKVSVMMSPRINSAYEAEEDDSDSNTLKRSSIYVPNYRIPLWEDETDNSRVYAVIHFPEGTNGDATNGEEPFYHLLEGPDLEEQFTGDEKPVQNDGLITINGDVFQVVEDQSAGPASFDNHIYAEVRRPKRRSAVKPKRSGEHSECRNEPFQEVLEPYIKGTEESEEQEAPCTENPIYFTLEKCFSDSFKGASNDPESKNAPACKVSEGPDQYKAICTEALVFCTKRSGSKSSNSYNNNETKFTIEQVFDDLEARYLKGTGEPDNSSQKNPGFSTQRKSLKEVREDSKRANESVYNFLEEVCRNGIPNYGAVSNKDGPVYFTLRRLKSNHSKATRIRPRCADESGSKKLDERFLKGAGESDESGDPSTEKPVFFTLESCCSDSLKRAHNDSTETNEPGGFILEERYLKRAEGSGQRFSSGKSVFHTLETFYSNSFKKPNSESQC